MVNEQHEMIVTKEKILIFRQLRVSDFENTERFLLYGTSAKNCRSFYKGKVVDKVAVCCKNNC